MATSLSFLKIWRLLHFMFIQKNPLYTIRTGISFSFFLFFLFSFSSATVRKFAPKKTHWDSTAGISFRPYRTDCLNRRFFRRNRKHLILFFSLALSLCLSLVHCTHTLLLLLLLCDMAMALCTSMGALSLGASSSSTSLVRLSASSSGSSSSSSARCGLTSSFMAGRAVSSFSSSSFTGRLVATVI